jgi:hypothetical protein
MLKSFYKNIREKIISLNPNRKEKPKPVRRFGSAAEATKEIHERYNVWSSGLSSHSLQATYAIIAANWAVHGSTAGEIISNKCALLSIIIAVGFLGFNICLTSWLTENLKDRLNFINADNDRWAKEFGNPENIKGPWPYTKTANTLSFILHKLRLLAPVTAAGFFIASLFLI